MLSFRSLLKKGDRVLEGALQLGHGVENFKARAATRAVNGGHEEHDLISERDCRDISGTDSPLTPSINVQLQKHILTRLRVLVLGCTEF